MVLDGDSRIDAETGEIISGAVSPDLVHIVLSDLGVNHCIYSSFSNDTDYNKFRVIIPCAYTRECVPVLLNYLFSELHKEGVMLANVKENRTWSQAWYFPRVPDERHKGLFQFYQFIEGENLNADVVAQAWSKDNPQPEPIEPPPLKPKNPIDETNGRRNPINGFNQAYGVHDVLIRNGYTLKNGAYLRPDSDSGIASVKLCLNCKDGVQRVYSHGNDVLNDGYAHDAFDCYRLLEHGGDFNTALNFDAELTKHNQRLFMQEQAKNTSPPSEFSFVDGAGWTKGAAEPFSLGMFTLNGQVAEMRKKMLNDKFVLGHMAIYGQATVFYAPPNAGKTLLTLKLLIDGIASGDINGGDVFYVNADDNYKGLVNKLELAEKHGFNMLSPGHNNFESKKFLEYLSQMVKDDSAKGKIIILDTLKKFTELMDKKAASDFMKTGREFISSGGTLILLAHTNKKRDTDGKVVFGGTSDIVDDVDCAYMLDAMKTGPFDTTRTVLFENIKSRGDVVKSVGYSYLMAAQSYSELIKSVKPIVEEEAAAAKLRDIFNHQLEKDVPVIGAVIEAIGQGINLKTEVIEYVYKTTGSSKKAINTVLTTYDGTSKHKHRWQALPGEKNAKIYALLNNTEASAADYRRVKNGDY